MIMSTEARTFEYFVDLARGEVLDDLADGLVTAEEIEAQQENGDYLEVSAEWAGSQSEYVYTADHRDLYAAGVLDDYLLDAEDMLSPSGAGPTVRGMNSLLGVAVILMLEAAHYEATRQAVEAVKMAAEYAAEQAQEVTA